MPRPETPTLLEAAEALDAFLAPARAIWDAGMVTHVTVAPGDMTSYRMTFVPASPVSFTTSWSDDGRTYPESAPVGPDDRLLVVHGRDRVIPIAPHSSPWPDYVAEKLATDNRYTLLAIGLTWWLMAGNSQSGAEVAYRDLAEAEAGKPNPLAEWDLSRLVQAKAVTA